MAFCSACGNEIKDSVNFCQDCGATQSKSEFIDEQRLDSYLITQFFLRLFRCTSILYRAHGNWCGSIINIRWLWNLGIHRFYYHFGRKFQGCAGSST